MAKERASQFKKEVNRLKQEKTRASEQLDLIGRIAKTEPDELYRNAELIKDVESVIIEEELIKDKNPMTHSVLKAPGFVKNIILPDDFKGSILPDNKVQMDENSVQQVGVSQAKNLTNSNGIYQLFYESIMKKNAPKGKGNQSIYSERTSVVRPREKVHRVLGIDINQLNADFGSANRAKPNDFLRSERGLENKAPFEDIRIMPLMSVRGVNQFSSAKRIRSEDHPLHYIAFPPNSIYNHPFYAKTLRLASLLSNSPIYEDDTVQINCQTESTVTDRFIRIDFELSYIPKILYSTLTTTLESKENIVCEPQNISDRKFDSPISQKFSLCFFDRPQLVDFPTLKIVLRSEHRFTQIESYLPFSVNKYMKEIEDNSQTNRISEKVH